MTPPQHTPQGPNRWNEYQALEARVHNDSVISYSVVGALTTSAVAAFVLAVAYIDPISDPWSYYSVVALAFVLLFFAITVQKRFNDTGTIRVARAVQLEQDLSMFSFRLFPPWCDFPADYFLTLGEMETGIRWDGTSVELRNYLECAGSHKYQRVMKSRRVSELFVWAVRLTVVILAVVLVAVAVL